MGTAASGYYINFWNQSISAKVIDKKCTRSLPILCVSKLMLKVWPEKSVYWPENLSSFYKFSLWKRSVQSFVVNKPSNCICSNHNNYEYISHSLAWELEMNLKTWKIARNHSLLVAKIYTWQNPLVTQLTFTCSKSTIETPKKRCEICSKLTIKIPERKWPRSCVFIASFEHISHVFLLFPLLTLNK